MALINYKEKQITCKIVYYGTGLGGKTTNLKYIHSQLAPSARGDIIMLATESERTLFFDFLPLDLGTIQGFHVRFSLFTVPGQVEYNASRKLILNGVDGIVFVSDSDVLRAKENVECLHNMIANLAEYDLTLGAIPWIIQYNKRDLTNAMSIERLERDCNIHGVPSFEAVANEGWGVFSTLSCISRLILIRLQ